ncbi:MAG: hypothetical protein QXL17_04035 [Candidatus Thermoplasmatota archaeon]
MGSCILICFIVLLIQPTGFSEQSGYATLIIYKNNIDNVVIKEGIVPYDSNMSAYQVGYAIYDRYTHQFIGIRLILT